MKYVQTTSFFGLYLRYVRGLHHLSLNEVMEQTLIDMGSLSKFEHGKMKLTKDNLERLCDCYQMNLEEILPFYEGLLQEIYSIIYLMIYKHYEDIEQFSYEQPKLHRMDYPFQLLKNFILHDYRREYDSAFLSLINQIQPYIVYYPNIFQKIFYTVLGFYYSTSNRNNYAMECLEKSIEIYPLEEVDGLNYLYLIPVYSAKNDYMKALDSFEKGLQIFQKYDNKNRIPPLLGNKASVHCILGNYRTSIEIQLQRYALTLESDIKGRFVALSNIAYQYCLLKKYEQAISYYLQAEEYGLDNCSCFETAWCYYQLGNRKACKQYLEKGRDCDIYSPMYTLFIDWLEAMLQKKYSSKSLGILKKIEREYSQGIAIVIYRFLCDCFISHYRYHKEYELAFEYVDKKIAEIEKVPNNLLIY